MANFCTKCGRPLPENGICAYCTDTSSTKVDLEKTDPGQQYQQQEQPYQGQYQQQSQPYQGQQYQQEGQPYQDQYQQQGPYQDQYQQQGPYQGQYQQQGPYQGQYQQQGPYQGQYQGPYNGGMSREAEWFNAKKDMLVSGTKNMFSEILPVLKAPVTRVQGIAATGSPAVGLEFVIAKAAVVLLIILVLLAKIRSQLDEGLMGFIGAADHISIPYFRIIFIALLLTVGVDCLQALLLKVFTSVFNGKTSFAGMITVVGARAMYQGVFFLVCALLLLLSPGTASILFMIGMIISPYIEFGGYIAVADLHPDRRPYAFLTVNLCMILLMFVFGYIFASDLMTSLPAILDNL